MFEGRAIWYLIPALLIGGALGAGISYWVGEKYIVSVHDGDPLQKQGGPSRSQEIDRR